MGNQQEGQQYKKTQAPPAMSKDDDFKKQGAGQDKKATPGMKDKDTEAEVDSDDDTAS